MPTVFSVNWVGYRITSFSPVALPIHHQRKSSSCNQWLNTLKAPCFYRLCMYWTMSVNLEAGVSKCACKYHWDWPAYGWLQGASVTKRNKGLIRTSGHWKKSHLGTSSFKLSLLSFLGKILFLFWLIYLMQHISFWKYQPFFSHVLCKSKVVQIKGSSYTEK